MNVAKHISLNELAAQVGLPIAWLKREADSGRLAFRHILDRDPRDRAQPLTFDGQHRVGTRRIMSAFCSLDR